MNAASQRRLTPALLLLLAVLAGLWLLLLSGAGSRAHWPAASPPSAAPVADRAAPLPPPVPRNQFAVVWQQPLFNPDRKPVTPSAGSGSIGELELTGVIITPTMHMALLYDHQGNRQVRLRAGKRVSGGDITLVEVKPRSAVFDTASGRVELSLAAGAPIDGPSSAPGQAAGPGPDSSVSWPSTPLVTPAPAEGPDGRPGEPAADATRAPAQTSPDTQTHTQTQRIRALREIIQKRRAAQAAAVHEGEH
ncbi:MAG TPA: hypothetical protein VLZ32_11785 [Rhodanobacter sp.]|nr:hypothetical protein [Rhodanobacter sp.]